MRTTYRLVALDLDGTLLTTDKSVTPRSRQVLAALHAQGVRIVLVTGRNLPMAREIAQLLPLDMTIIAHNGALIANSPQGRVLHGLFLSAPSARELCEAFRQWECAPFLYTAEEGKYCLRHDGCGSNPALRRYLMANQSVCAPVPSVVEMLSLPARVEVISVVAIEPRERVQRALKEMPLVEGARIMTSGGLYGGACWFLEAVHSRASKVNALAAICADWGISLREVIAIGDNLNDVELLREAGFGIAMGNAPEEVKAAARMVTSSNDEEGVAEALARLQAEPL